MILARPFKILVLFSFKPFLEGWYSINLKTTWMKWTHMKLNQTMYGHNNINMRWMKLIMYNSQEIPQKIVVCKYHCYESRKDSPWNNTRNQSIYTNPCLGEICVMHTSVIIELAHMTNWRHMYTYNQQFKS